jgi:hypothetical protein
MLIHDNAFALSLWKAFKVIHKLMFDRITKNFSLDIIPTHHVTVGRVVLLISREMSQVYFS